MTNALMVNKLKDFLEKDKQHCEFQKKLQAQKEKTHAFLEHLRKTMEADRKANE